MNKTRTILTPRDKKYVAARVKGSTKRQAALAAGLPTPIAADKYAERVSKNVAIQKAIDDALVKHGADPEFAVQKIVNIANMELDNKSAPSVLKASDKILELHGYRSGEKPSMTLNINSFFSKFDGASGGNVVVDGDVEQGNSKTIIDQ
jgi:hypothetical protein